MHHLDEVAGAVLADVGAARLAVDVSRDLLENRAHDLVAGCRASGHDRRPLECALFSAGNAGADESDAALGHFLLAANRVGVQGVTAVDDDVAFVERRSQLIDDGVCGRAGLNHDERAARRGEGIGELRDRLGANKGSFVAVGFEKRVGLRDRAVVQRHGETVPGEVTGDVRSHHGQSRDSDVCFAVCGGLCGRRRCVSHGLKYSQCPVKWGGQPVSFGHR